jgi:hypothetical protein
MIELVSDTDYVKSKLNSGQFNDSAIVEKTGVTRFYIKKVRAGVSVKPYVISALTNYFRKIGE